MRKKLERSSGNSYLETHWKTGAELMCHCSYELFFVCWLNELKIDFEWQILITLTNRSVYWVDLYLPDVDVWIEIKGCWFVKGFKKWTEFHESHPNLLVLRYAQLKVLGYSSKKLFDVCLILFRERMRIWYKTHEQFVGKCYDRLTIVRPANDAHINSDRVDYKWVTRCECGTEFIVRHYALLSGNTRSCGCMFREKLDITHAKLGRPIQCLIEGVLHQWPSALAVSRETGAAVSNITYWAKRLECGWSYVDDQKALQ